MALELKTVLRCEHGEVTLPNCGCVARLSQLAEDAREMLDDRGRALDALMALVRELPKPGRAGNAPGHAHQTPGVWDDDPRLVDNAPLAGRRCSLCAAYAQAVAIVGEKP